MTDLEHVLFFVGVFVVVIAFNIFIHWSERRDARAAAREIQALRETAASVAATIKTHSKVVS